MVDSGLWNSSSWMAHLRFHQIARMVTRTRARACWFIVSQSQKFRRQASSVLFDITCSISLSPKAQTQRAIRDSNNEYLHLSSDALHMEQSEDVAMLRSCLVLPVGKDVYDNVHANTLAFDGTLTSQSCDHDFLSAPWSYYAIRFSSQSSLWDFITVIILYAE